MLRQLSFHDDRYDIAFRFPLSHLQVLYCFDGKRKRPFS